VVTEVRIYGDSPYRRGERRGIALWDQQPIVVASQDFRGASDRGRNNGQTSRRGLEDDIR
jgi:hypothetical protein